MSSARLQDRRPKYKSQLHSCTLAMKNLETQANMPLEIDIPSSCIRRHIPKIHLQIQCNLHQNPKLPFCSNWPFSLKKMQETQINLRKKNKVGGHFSNFKTYCKEITTKIIWYWCEDKNTDRWNRTEIPEISAHIYE